MTTHHVIQPTTASTVLGAAPNLRAYFERGTKNLFSNLRDSWRELASSGANAEPFYQPEWFEAFVDSFGKPFPTFIASVWQGQKLKGIAPFMKRRTFFGGIPARTYHSLSNIHSCRYDLLLDPEDSNHTVKLMWNTLRRDKSWDVMEVDDVPEDGRFPQLMREAEESGFLVGFWPTRKIPRVLIGAPSADPFQHCSRDFESVRSRLKRKLRKLEKQTKVKFDVHTSNFEDAFRRFLLLESSGWKGANKSAIASDQVTARFYNAAFERLHSRGCVRMYSLSAGDKVIAMQLGVVMNGVYYVPKSAYNEEFSSYSPGQLLNLHVIGDLAANGFHTYDFLGPKALWKMVWAPTTRDHHNCYIFRPSVKGRILHALTMRAAKAARAVRHRVWGDPQALFASTFW